MRDYVHGEYKFAPFGGENSCTLTDICLEFTKGVRKSRKFVRYFQGAMSPSVSRAEGAHQKTPGVLTEDPNVIPASCFILRYMGHHPCCRNGCARFIFIPPGNEHYVLTGIGSRVWYGS